jgi:hypothetical protein
MAETMRRKKLELGEEGFRLAFGQSTCQHCQGKGAITETVDAEELNNRREAAIVASIEGLKISEKEVEDCLMGTTQREDPRVGRILESWIGSLLTEATTEAPTKYLTFAEKLVQTGMHNGTIFSETTSEAIKDQWPSIYETVLRASVNNAVSQGSEIDPYVLREHAYQEAQTRFLAFTLGKMGSDRSLRGEKLWIFGALSKKDYIKFTEQLGERGLLRKRTLEAAISADDYYQVFAAMQIEYEAVSTSGGQKVRYDSPSWNVRKHLTRMLEAKLAAKGGGHVENAQLRALAAGIEHGQLAYKQGVTGSNTFKVWIEDGSSSAANYSEREFDTSRPGDWEDARAYAAQLKTRVASNNDHLEQERFCLSGAAGTL